MAEGRGFGSSRPADTVNRVFFRAIRRFLRGGATPIDQPCAVRNAHADKPAGRLVRIGIVGTFDVENYGDLIFPLIAEFELGRRLEKFSLLRFSYNGKRESDWPYEVLSIARLPDLMGELDALLIGGGYLIRFDKAVAPGYEPPEPGIHHPTGYWLTPGLIANVFGVPVLWNAPGMHGNAVPAWARPLLATMLELSAYVSVRDRETKAALSGFAAATSIDVVPDTAFGMQRLLTSLQIGNPIEGPYVVYQPAEWNREFANFVDGHRDSFAPYALVALPVSPIHGDRSGDEDADWPSPLEIAKIISGASAVVGHSYHMAITALTAGVPVFLTVDFALGKFGALRDYEGVHRLAEATSAEWFFSKLGRKTVAPSVVAAQEALNGHWDRIAAIAQAGPVDVRRELARFFQNLPTLLDTWSER